VAGFSYRISMSSCRKGARPLRLLLFSACCLLGAFRTALAVDPGRMLSQYSHTAWRLQDGDLPSPVFPITQTRDGYLWIGTQAGVLRFDGARFIPLDKLAGRALPSSFVTSLLGASDGSFGSRRERV